MAKLSGAGASFRAARWLAATACVFFPVLVWAGWRKKPASAEPPPVRATVQPAFTIPIEPFGFSAPAAFYLGTRNSLVSLDFLDEDHLLFSFRVPGLIHRDHREPVNSDAEERRVRAMVLALPRGTGQAEAARGLHERGR